MSEVFVSGKFDLEMIEISNEEFEKTVKYVSSLKIKTRTFTMDKIDSYALILPSPINRTMCKYIK